jgi:cysteine desulfurase/selenocysteine lyase
MNSMLDITSIREDFPILHTEMRGHPLVYLDNAATTQKPRSVIQALVEYYERYNANIHRGVYAIAEEATAAYESTRAKVAQFVNAPTAASIVFTRNTTEVVNLVAHAWGRKFLRPGDEVVITEMEHHSNIVPWQLAARAGGASLRFIPVGEDGTLDMTAARSVINGRTRIVACSHVSNVVGTINPVAEIADLAHRHGALVLVDAAQSVPHMPVDVQALDIDFLAFSSHKMLGPTGVGVLYGRPEILESMDPYMGGGEMIATVEMEASTWNDLPWKFEAGTPNIADVIALAPAVDYLQALGMAEVRRHEVELTAYAVERLLSIPGLALYGPKNPAARGGVTAFTLADVHPHDIGQVLDSRGIAIRAGQHCAQPLARRLGVVATSRASYYIYNTKAEIDALFDGLRDVQRMFAAPAAAAAP